MNLFKKPQPPKYVPQPEKGGFFKQGPASVAIKPKSLAEAINDRVFATWKEEGIERLQTEYLEEIRPKLPEKKHDYFDKLVDVAVKANAIGERKDAIKYFVETCNKLFGKNAEGSIEELMPRQYLHTSEKLCNFLKTDLGCPPEMETILEGILTRDKGSVLFGYFYGPVYQWRYSRLAYDELIAAVRKGKEEMMQCFVEVYGVRELVDAIRRSGGDAQAVFELLTGNTPETLLDKIAMNAEKLHVEMWRLDPDARKIVDAVASTMASGGGGAPESTHDKAVLNKLRGAPLEVIFSILSGTDEVIEPAMDSYEKVLRKYEKDFLNACLWKAVDDYECDFVELLVSIGADVDFRDTGGRTSLMLASMRNDDEMVSTLLGRGAKTELKDNDGKTALVYAIEAAVDTQYVKICRKVRLRYRVRAASTETDDGVEAPIEEIPAEGECVENPQNEEGYAARIREALLSWLTYQYTGPPRDGDALYALLEHGADINARDSKGRTPIMHAFGNPEGHIYTDLLPFLVRRGADVDARDGGGNSVLFHAVKYGNAEIAGFVAGKVDKKKNSCAIVLEYAKRHGLSEIVHAFEENGLADRW